MKDRYVIGIVFAIVAIFGFFVSRSIDKSTRECEAKGGVYHASRDGSMCLKKDAVL